MQERPRRPRRIVNPRTLRVLRILGYRYSFNREAWVHRIGGGRFGPVFTEIASTGLSEMTPELIDQLQERLNEPDRIRIAPADERPPLPHRASRHRQERLIPVRWLHDEEHSLVYVDGRPPLVGTAQRAKREVSDPTVAPVVPIKRTRATG